LDWFSGDAGVVGETASCDDISTATSRARNSFLIFPSSEEIAVPLMVRYKMYRVMHIPI
jgi:hypothetical protein